MTSDELSDLSTIERRFLATILRRLRAGGTMIRGSFAEAIVADALPDARETTMGTDPWDLEWEGLRIEVKSTGVGTWQVPEKMLRDGKRLRRRHAHVYVLASHDGEDLAVGWEFFVVPTGALDERGKGSITLRGVRRLVDSVGLDDLATAVRSAGGPR